MLPLVITTSSLDIPNLHQQSWQTTLAHQLLQVIQLSDLITTNPTCVQDNLLYFGSTLIVEWETNQSTISRLHCHITATLPYQGYFAIARLFCHIKGTLPYHGYFAISRLLCHTTATLPYQGYFAISRSLCHTTATLPYQGYYAIARLFCHIKVTLPYQGYYTISRLQCHQRSKQNPPKTFPVKENCHTIKSAGVHAFHPHLSFCLKLSRFIPAFHILSSFDPYESPPFDISPGDKRGNPRRCCYVSRPTTQRLQQAASQRSALQQ